MTSTTSPVRITAAFAGLALIAAVASAGVEDQWTETTTFSRSTVAQLRVLEPDGYTIKLRVGDDDVTDTIPAVISVPNADSFYKLTLVAPGGAQWAKKVEIKRGQTTEMRVKHVAAKADPKPEEKAPAKARTFVGWVQGDAKQCDRRNRDAEFRVELLTSAGDVIAAGQAKSGRSQEIKAPQGAYELRMYARSTADGEWVYQATGRGSVTADGYTVTAGCRDNAIGAWLEY